jgi:hypothetical protein
MIYLFRVDQLIAVEDLNGYRFGIQVGYQKSELILSEWSYSGKYGLRLFL